MKKLYPHQQKFLNQNPSKALLNWETRSGKSLPASLWVDHPCRSGNTFIICPKQLKKDWLAFKTKATVLTKEEFKKIAHTIENPTAIVVDEVHTFSSPLFIKGRSQMATALYELVKKYPDCHFLGLSATMIRQNAWSLHSVLCYAGIYYPWKEWRSKFFELKKMPFLRFPAWFPKKNWRTEIRPFLEKNCSIVSLSDIVEDLPPVISTVITIKQPKYTAPVDKVVTWVDEHMWEQQGKAEEIMKLGYKKVIVVCKYTQQIDSLQRELAEDKPVYVLDGRTKDPSDVKTQAQNADECYFIVQASMLIGWDGYHFGAMVFTSMSHACVDYVQACGRQRHLKHLRPVVNVFILGGRWDRRVYETVVILGKEFNPFIYLNEQH